MHIAGGVGMIQLSIRKQFPNFVPPQRRRAAIPEAATEGESEYTRYDRRVADIAVQWLRDAAEAQKPWVLFVSFVTPHYPLVAPKEFFDLYPVDAMPDPTHGPGSSYQPHPWLADLLAGGAPSPRDQRRALAAYLGLVSFMDAQVGRVLTALDEAGLRETTRILYTSDHGENAGKRGFWGKSNHYQEAAAVPMIVAGEGVPAGKLCATPVSLTDAYPSVLDAVGLSAESDHVPGRSLFALANQPDERDRIAFSEYHAAGSPSASYMLRKGRFKLIYYVGFAPELFDLDADPEETTNLAARADHAAVVRELEAALRDIVDPEAVDHRANAAQRALIESKGGPDQVMQNLPTKKNYTPVPSGLLS
jgi:choline-sulfatase